MVAVGGGDWVATLLPQPARKTTVPIITTNTEIRREYNWRRINPHGA
jgi:hypothetical protein